MGPHEREQVQAQLQWAAHALAQYRAELVRSGFAIDDPVLDELLFRAEERLLGPMLDT